MGIVFVVAVGLHVPRMVLIVPAERRAYDGAEARSEPAGEPAKARTGPSAAPIAARSAATDNGWILKRARAASLLFTIPAAGDHFDLMDFKGSHLISFL
jgi:hypothetical protein